MKKRIIFFTVTFALATALTAAAKSDTTAVQPFDRGIGKSNACFIPKGSVGAGISFSYSKYNLGNMSDDAGYSMLFSLIQDLHGNMTSFSISPFVSYFVSDNLAVGARFNYERLGFGLNGVNLSISDDLGLSLKDFHHFKQSYTGSVTLRNYMPLANSKRFALFTELRATGGYAQSETYKKEDEGKYGTYQDIYKFELGAVPGVSAFITNEVALEISVGLLGFDYQKVVQVTNQVEKSQMEKSGANFKINLFSINFGMSFYLQTGQNRPKKNKK